MFLKTKQLFISSLVTMSMVGCANVNEGLNTLNNGLATVNQILGAPNTTTGQSTSAPNLARITTAQTNLISQNINKGQQQASAKMRIAITEASPNIEKVIRFISCYPNFNPQKFLNQYEAPNEDPFITHTPISRMQYHPKTQCVSVVRFQDWSMPAANALKFQVVYQSDSSGESNTQKYEMVKQPSGEWLYKRTW